MKSSIHAIVARSIARLGDVSEQATYTQVTSGTYDTDSGSISTTTTSREVRCIFTNYSLREVNISQGRIEVRDMRVLILPSELTGLTPKFEDTFTRANGEVWRIVPDGLSLDPAESLYQIQVRQTQGATS